MPAVTLLGCFLPAVLTSEARCRGALRQQLRRMAWPVYQARNKAALGQRVRRLREWASGPRSGAIQERVLQLGAVNEQFQVAYDFPAAARTTKGIARLMDYQDRVLYQMRYFHGTRQAARLAARAMALQGNFHPYSLRAQRQGTQRSPFEALNGFHYHDNWLHNLLSAASQWEGTNSDHEIR